MARPIYSSAVVLTLLLLSLVATGSSEDNPTKTSSVPFDQVQFKATHNSYRLTDLPSVQIDAHQVWEIELDFGLTFDDDNFVVGHDAPEPKQGQRSLGDWIRNVLSAEAPLKHPLIIKLEAKTHGPCSPLRFPSFRCGNSWDKDWQQRLTDSLLEWISEARWITPVRWRDEFDSTWPSVNSLAGQVIVTLQDSNDDRHIDTLSPWFFGRGIPDLRAAWPPIENAEDWRKAVNANCNRPTLNGAYRTLP